MTEEASFQAPRWSSLVRKPVKVGMKAEARAPPATRLKSSSVMRLAALKESRSAEVPKALVRTVLRSTPIRLEKTKAAITVRAARAIRRLAVWVGAGEDIEGIITSENELLLND